MPISPHCNISGLRQVTSWMVGLLGAIFAVSTIQGREIEPRSFYVNYSAQVPTAPLQATPLAIVHPDAEVALTSAHTSGTTVLAYLSVGEIASDAPYRDQASEAGLRTTGVNPIWKSNYLDLTDTRWADLIIDQLAAAAVAKGFDGFFLDTLDSVQLAAPDDETRTTEIKNALIALIRRLHKTYPAQKIIVNRGLFAFDALRDSIDGVLVESLYTTWDFTEKVNKPVSPMQTQALLTALEKVTAAGREVYVIDYASPGDFPGADRTASQIQSHGFHAFVTTPELDGTMLAPTRFVPRRICAFYGNLEENPDDQIRWPADTFTKKVLQTPLEWLGYEIDYFKVNSIADLPVLKEDYVAIVFSRHWEIPITLEKRFLDWLINQKDSGKKIIIFGSLPFADYEQRERFIMEFGMGGNGEIISSTQATTYAHAELTMVGYETEIPPLPNGQINLQAPKGAEIILSIEGRTAEQKLVNYDPVFLCEWGGMALDPYALYTRADFVQFWNIDPFAFFIRALERPAFPIPDTTTRDGKRMFLSHIDGDGFANGNWVEPGRLSSEVVRDRILKKYPLPVTVSIIEAELRGQVTGQDEANVPHFESIARDIFELPHVEAASHSYSHPFYWISDDPTRDNYDTQYLPLKIPYPGIDYVREVDGSVRYINEQLSHSGNPVKVFLWSGNCRPPPAALARVRELGIVNVNGGDTLISKRKPTITAVAPRTMPWHDELQIYAPNQNENVYTNDWQGPLFGTFVHVLDTFKLTETPRRLKPVNVYYHFYSADYPASLHALETIHDWVMTQPLHSVTLSQYARLAQDARNTRIFRAGHESWMIVNQGYLRTLRLPSSLAKRISMQNSQGITGWEFKDEEAYIHTDGSPVTRITLAAQPVELQARLVSSTAEIRFGVLSNRLIEFTCQDLREIEVIFAGLIPNSSYEQLINGTQSTTSADAAGRLTLVLPSESSVRLRAISP